MGPGRYIFPDGCQKGSFFPAELSFSAGTFVCNEVMYRLLETDLPGGFVHVHCAAKLPHKKENFALPFVEIVRGLEICVRELSHTLS